MDALASLASGDISWFILLSLALILLGLVAVVVIFMDFVSVDGSVLRSPLMWISPFCMLDDVVLDLCEVVLVRLVSCWDVLLGGSTAPKEELGREPPAVSPSYMENVTSVSRGRVPADSGSKALSVIPDRLLRDDFPLSVLVKLEAEALLVYFVVS